MEDEEYEALRRVEDAHWWFRGRRERALRLAGEHGIGGRILDVGCGTGANAAAFGDVVAVDLSRRAVLGTRERGIRRVARADIGRLPFRSGAFDAVLAFDVLEHLEDDLAGLREIGRVLRGSAIVTVPACPPLYGPHDRALHHHRRYGRAQFLALARRAGFPAVRHIGYYAGSAFPLLLAWRWIQKTLVRGRGRSDMGRRVPSWLNRLLLPAVRIPLPLGGTLVAVISNEA